MVINMIKEYSMGGVALWLLSLDEIPETDFDRMYACCSKERQEAANRLKHELKRKQCVGAGFLLHLLKERFSIEEEPIVLPGGKPVFREERGVHFNISHSGGFAALAFGKTPLGLDIECVKRADCKVAKRFFQKEEYAYLAGKTESEQADVFCELWTGKEAVIKATGAGLSVPLDSFSVLGEIVELEGKRYGLYRQRIAEGGQILMVCAAQIIL